MVLLDVYEFCVATSSIGMMGCLVSCKEVNDNHLDWEWPKWGTANMVFVDEKPFIKIIVDNSDPDFDLLEVSEESAKYFDIPPVTKWYIGTQQLDIGESLKLEKAYQQWIVANAQTEKNLAPRRPRTAYILFSQEMYPKIKEMNPETSATDRCKLAAETWNKLSEQDKKKYRDIYSKEKEQYDIEIAKYSQRSGNNIKYFKLDKKYTINFSDMEAFDNETSCVYPIDRE